MSPARQIDEGQLRVDDEIALDSTFLLRKVVHLCLVHDFAQEATAIERDFIINSQQALVYMPRR